MKIEPTKISNLILIFIFMTSFGWSVARLWPTWFEIDLHVPALAPITIYVLAIALTVWTLMVKARLNPDNKQVSLNPIVGARSAALAMTSSRVGSLGAGLYLGIFLVNLLQREHSTVVDRLWASGLSVLGGIIVTVVALWLERICKIKQPPTNSQAPGAPA